MGHSLKWDKIGILTAIHLSGTSHLSELFLYMFCVPSMSVLDFEQTPTCDYEISPPDSEIFRSEKVAISRHRTGVSSDIAREWNQPKRVVVAWKICEMCVYKKNKNCVSLVKTSNMIENFQKK